METRKSVRPKAISLFSGAGGMDIGFRKAGFDIIASVEIDPSCCDTLRANLEGQCTKVIEQDIRNIVGSDLCKSFGLKVGELDCLFGGPPCQSFSLAGRRGGLDDERGLMLLEFFRLVDEIRPKVFVLENVKGLLNWQSGAVLDFIYNKFDREVANSLPYLVEHKCLDAASFGVPQFRERVFFVGNRIKGKMDFPTPTHIVSVRPQTEGKLKSASTVFDAIGNLPPATPPSKMASRVSQTIKGRIARHGY